MKEEKVLFTGIIQEIGRIKQLENYNSGLRLYVDLGKLISENLQIGESISINGSCHTLEKLHNTIGQFFSSSETLSKTNFGLIRTGDFVNLELSLTPSTRMGGHFVSGHIDSVAKLLSYKQIGESYEVFFEIPDYLSKYVVNKGSVCLNGISLTVAKIENQSNVFSVAIIPHTWNETNLKYLKIGDLVNFEVDILSKYTEKLLQTNIGNN